MTERNELYEDGFCEICGEYMSADDMEAYCGVCRKCTDEECNTGWEDEE